MKHHIVHEGDSGEKKNPRGFFRWFLNFLKEEKVFLPVFLIRSFILNGFSNLLSFNCRKYH